MKAIVHHKYGSPDDPVIDRAYALSATAEAIRHLEEGHPRGKVVITL